MTKLTDAEVIRAAVELAKWEVTPERQCVIHPIELWGKNINNPIVLDALAAQLVRQVDETIKFTITTYRGVSAVIGKGGRWTQYEGECRTMNTLRAIVESEVLNND